ncbi:MAG: GAF domain-containing protein [Deltaproteobacteria bacterium]|nr:MAG: GAF domain-containing protein [Deltaproteobacteria bacterium]TMQ18379.1 MAG: GAF domain-containing protein [Deltaproteobacteria bacterium]
MESIALAAADKPARYRELLPQISALLDGEPDLIANLANTAAALRACVTAASWIGFYVRRGDELVLGPFQGKVACVRIALGHGVCGTAAAERRTLIVPDVERFPGHIACDAGSRSEIVVPIFRAGRAGPGDVVAVLDLDSYDLAAFDEADAAGLAPIAELLGTLAW